MLRCWRRLRFQLRWAVEHSWRVLNPILCCCRKIWIISAWGCCARKRRYGSSTRISGGRLPIILWHCPWPLRVTLHLGLPALVCLPVLCWSCLILCAFSALGAIDGKCVPADPRVGAARVRNCVCLLVVGAQ